MSYTYDNHYHFETIQLHAGQENPDPATDARAVPIYQTIFLSSSRTPQHAAARFATRQMQATSTADLTNSDRGCHSSSELQPLRAAWQHLASLPVQQPSTIRFTTSHSAGDNIVSAKTIYGGTYNLLEHTLPQYGITATFVDPDE